MEQRSLGGLFVLILVFGAAILMRYHSTGSWTHEGVIDIDPGPPADVAK